LLNAGANVNILRGEHDTALRAAVVGGHARVVDLLISSSADPNLSSSAKDAHGRVSEPIMKLAVSTRCPRIVESLLAAGADVNLGLPNH